MSCECIAFCSSGELQQHLFLGLTIQDYSADNGLSDTTSELSVVLVEDTCTAPTGGAKICYDLSLDRQEVYTADPGFIGENRYLSAETGTEYSAEFAKDGADTLVRAAINILGSPVYFRHQNFEFSGIVSDWVKNVSTSGTTYRVKITDPRLILEGCKLILGSYSNRVDKDVYCNGITPYNLFNVFGYMETIDSTYCPAVTQYPQYTYNVGSECSFPFENDGYILGSPSGYFGGSLRNERGIPLFKVIDGINYLVNQLIIPSGILPYSPLGRIVYPCANTTSVSSEACGILPQDASTGGIPICGYFLDISELPDFSRSIYYRIEDEFISILDLITRVCDDAGYDYYIELVIVKDASFANGIGKFIKLRTINRKVQPSLNNIGYTISEADCVESYSYGLELRNEDTSSFVIGANKRTIYQALNVSDPDGGGEGVIQGIINYYDLSGGVILSDTYAYDSGNDCSDDMILPYFGKFQNNNIRLPYCVENPGSGESSTQWAFLVDTSEISTSLNSLTFETYDFVEITENDLRFALIGYEEWRAWIMHQEDGVTNTRLWQALVDINPTATASLSFQRGPQDLINAINNANEKNLPRDLNNARKNKHAKVDNFLDMEDLKTIYSWVYKYAKDFYGSKYMVRVPYTCVFPDLESVVETGTSIGYIVNKRIISDQPTNSGGWTEYGNVLGLSLFSNAIRFFINGEGLIKPFIAIDDYTIDTSNFSPDTFIIAYSVDSGDADYVIEKPPPSYSGSNITYNEKDGRIYYRWFDGYYRPLTPSEAENSTSTSPPVNNVYVRTSSTEGVLRVWNGSTWIDVGFRVFISASVEDEYVFVDYQSNFSPRVVISVPQAIHKKRNTASHVAGYDKMAEAIKNSGKNVGNIADITSKVGGKNVIFGLHPAAIMIKFAAIPIESLVLRYGPWFNYGAPGRIKFIKDDELAPWNFGSYQTMKIAGSIIASESVTAMRFGEVGSITIPGTPCIPLGAEIGAYNDTFYQAGSHLLENRNYSTGTIDGTNYEYLQTPLWTGTYGPNITSLSISFGHSGIHTNYTMRTFANRRGVLNKYLVDRLKKNRQNFLAASSAINEKISEILSNITKANIILEDKRYSVRGLLETPGSEHEVFIGQNVPFNTSDSGETFDFVRPIVSSGRMEEISLHIQGEYDKKALMSIDGLIRPISMDGDGGLSPFFDYGEATQTTLYTDCELTAPATGESFVITGDDLNPFSNPAGFSRSHVVENRSDTPNIGHDIEILGRSSGEEGVIIPNTGYANEYKGDYSDDYRAFALRGPLVLKSWCYDLDGYPVPNKVDTPEDASVGIFETSGLTQKFMDDWLRKSESWPVAPVDLRLDRDRGVFTIASTLTKSNFVIVTPCEEGIDSCFLNSGNSPDYDITCPTFPGKIISPIYAEDRFIEVLNPMELPIAANARICCLVISNQFIAVYSSVLSLTNDLITDYDSNESQVLVRDGACLKWVSTTSCSSGEDLGRAPEPVAYKTDDQSFSGETYEYDSELTVLIDSYSLYKIELYITYTGGLQHKFSIPSGSSGNMVMSSNNEVYSSLLLTDEKTEDPSSGEATIIYNGIIRTDSEDGSISFMARTQSGEDYTSVINNSYIYLTKIS